MTKRVVICEGKASRGWWEPGNGANNEPHFGDAFLNISRVSREEPR